jgi:hypothetical protein
MGKTEWGPFEIWNSSLSLGCSLVRGKSVQEGITRRVAMKTMTVIVITLKAIRETS